LCFPNLLGVELAVGESNEVGVRDGDGAVGLLGLALLNLAGAVLEVNDPVVCRSIDGG